MALLILFISPVTSAIESLVIGRAERTGALIVVDSFNNLSPSSKISICVFNKFLL